MRPSVDMAVQYKPALASQVKFMQPQTLMKTQARARMIPAKAEAELTRRAMVVLGLGAAAGKGAAVAAEGTPEFRPEGLKTKQAIAGIPKGLDGKPMPETIDPGFLPSAAVFIRINELLEKAQSK